MQELPVVVDLAGEICVVLFRGFENHLVTCQDHGITIGQGWADLGAIGEFVGRKVDLTERSLAYKSTQRVIPNSTQFFRREPPVEATLSVGFGWERISSDVLQ